MKISRKRRTKFIHKGNESRKFMKYTLQFYILVNETLNEKILFHVFDLFPQVE